MNCKMRTLIVVAIVFAFGWCLSAFADADRGDRSFWGVGNLEKSWNRMSKYEKCVAAIMIPPGYVIGICSKSYAWLFGGRREF